MGEPNASVGDMRSDTFPRERDNGESEKIRQIDVLMRQIFAHMRIHRRQMLHAQINEAARAALPLDMATQSQQRH